MKTLKKALSVILGLAIMLSCVMGMQVSVAAEGTLAVSVGEATVADGVVTVPVVVDANTGFQAMTVTAAYDSAVLTLVGAEKAAFSDAEDKAVFGPYTANPFKMMWAYALSEENITATGEIAILTFNVVEGADVDSTDINIEVTEAWDVNGNAVTATATDGTVDFVTEPVVDSNLVFYRTSLAYGTSSLEYNFRIANTVLALYDNVEVVIVPQKYDMTTLNLVENPIEIVVAKADLAAAGTKYMQYTYTDIQLYELGLNIDYMLRAYDADGELVAVSEIFSTSIASLLADNAADASKSAAYRTLCVDTLVVCDEVMKNVAKSYADSDLADAVVAGSVLEGVDMSLATQTISACNTVNNFVSYDDAYLQSTSTHQIRSSVAIGKVPYINFRVKDQQNALDLSKLEINVQYTSKDSAGEHPYDKTFSGADLTDAAYINCTFDEVGFHDSDKDILFTVYYDGVKKCEWTYSIETYLDGLKDSENTGAQMTALIKLGQSFRTYQGL